MKRAGGLNGRKMSFHTGSRRSQPPLALAVPLSRFTADSETIVNEFDVDVACRFSRIRQVP
jgi:hypothetical protein